MFQCGFVVGTYKMFDQMSLVGNLPMSQEYVWVMYLISTICSKGSRLLIAVQFSKVKSTLVITLLVLRIF